MYIKSIILEGFKSYAQRTEICDFDPSFNAITGLNGSGKSNILDSICFVLGISNLSQVRASNLHDLVYKNGQAGVSKATVSITFDNSDKKHSPLGFENSNEITVTRQAVVGGRNKYLINGINASNNRVQDLFCSVGLNVNNPHFLIMQGRITKVLNMKPTEILSMIEEAAGTRMYECKKMTAQKTIEKKEAKLDEIRRIITEEISPSLEKLKEARASYLEYQKITREMENLKRVCVAFQYIHAEEIKDQTTNALKEANENKKKNLELMAVNEEKVKELAQQIEDMEKKNNKEFGAKLQSLEAALSELQRVDAKVRSDLDHKKKNLSGEKKRHKELTKVMQEEFKAITSKEKEIKSIQEDLNGLQEESKKGAEALATAQQHFNGVSAGLSSNVSGRGSSLADQMMTCKNEISKAVTEAKQAKMKLKYAQQELKTKQAKVKKVDGSYKEDQATLEAVRKSKEKLQDQMKKLKYEEGEEEAHVAKKKALISEIISLRELCESIAAKHPHLHFEYKNPEKNWNPSYVKGLVVTLITVKDISTSKALEAVAGGKLYHIVVDTEATGRKIIEKGQLKHRYTIIPLNKISAKCIGYEIISLAKELIGHLDVHIAISLIDYNIELQKAMEFVFGTTLVCSNMDKAKKVTFDKRIMKKSVTLQGEIFDPQGTLSGGASAHVTSILVKLKTMREAEEKLKIKKSLLEAVERELANLKNTAEKYQHLKQQLEMKVEEEGILQAKIRQSSYHKQQEDLFALEKTIVECEEALKETKENQQKAEEEYKALENKMKNAESEHEKEIKNAQQKLNSAKKKADDSSRKMKEKQQEIEALVLELEQLKQEQASYKQQSEAVEQAITSLQEQVDALEAEATKANESLKEAENELAKQKGLIAEQTKGIKDKSAEIEKYRKENNKLQLNNNTLEHDISKYKQEAADASSMVCHSCAFLSIFWITSEKELFGQSGTTYDFEINNPKEASQKLQKLMTKKEKLEKSLNMRAINLLSEAEEKYNDLMKKKRIVENDKSKILATIEELDRKKIRALNIAWEKVNKDFGSIFSMLLPGAKAMLVPSKKQSILDGLEFRVGLGNIWKENLTELSGGQRSLVALSLILAILLFKPAPIYILDEVDAALDLSHTQNIGQMLHAHFKQSQFLVVSLKDGMFNNANVLYRTKFVDGVSTVTRHCQLKKKKALSRKKKTSLCIWSNAAEPNHRIL
uniref:Structural maintenance of chromosomes protein n=1 Tax=Coturnix japonica TaxID=93934 RepID=A0A8C2SU23_COTJA